MVSGDKGRGLAAKRSEASSSVSPLHIHKVCGRYIKRAQTAEIIRSAVTPRCVLVRQQGRNQAEVALSFSV